MSDEKLPCDRQTTTRTPMNKEQAARWLVENQDAIADWNAFVEKNGLPLANYRQF
ncbi:type II toxin-antitoxin system CcdA family antitoxin [Nitrospirillum sp. BR 11163]|uniref:type II toxin-antitoxin system CcdA family antitoxin n=1 Tax=Nitrospirillum sp. BR 11163 TaxID=3104323 RepID=UPI002AFDD61D|nr:type II toxin-antitoxin system CcdA family antitoxin [Nitrospirillum sp. BR 11163]MEA1674812.1 type II toxin-antitoxin system CcdA family antitoxin [Nitrospirillum sp. BR 11163]